MKLVIVSTFWNAERFVPKCIESLKNQYYTNFVAYFIDDMSTDNSFEVAKKTIGNDERFILIKNEEKKYKTKNFIDVIRHNDNIAWDDVIIEIDGDDRLADNFVLGRINKVFMDDNIWLCGTRFKDNYGNLGNYSKPDVERARKTIWNFSHMRSYRAFLFREIKDEHLRYNGEYFKAACDIGFAVPMMEMSGEEHFYYINEPLYIYNWHSNQSYTESNSFNDSKLQSKIGSYIYSRLPQYDKIVFISQNVSDNITSYEMETQPYESGYEKLKRLVNFNDKKRSEVDYVSINNVLNKVPKFYQTSSNSKPIRENIPQNRNDLNQMRKDSLSKLARDLFQGKKRFKG